jgi:hypothetical protein
VRLLQPAPPLLISTKTKFEAIFNFKLFMS